MKATGVCHNHFETNLKNRRNPTLPQSLGLIFPCNGWFLWWTPATKLSPPSSLTFANEPNGGVPHHHDQPQGGHATMAFGNLANSKTTREFSAGFFETGKKGNKNRGVTISLGIQSSSENGNGT